MAGMRTGIGPFVGVYLRQHRWTNGVIGAAMTVGTIADMLVRAPVGVIIDATHYKRA